MRRRERDRIPGGGGRGRAVLRLAHGPARPKEAVSHHTGAVSLGGEYAAINSATDELVPAQVRGNGDLVINATFWIGAALGAGCTLFLLNSGRMSPAFGWRFAFGIGALLGLIILLLRKSVPESPLALHARDVDGIRRHRDCRSAG